MKTNIETSSENYVSHTLESLSNTIIIVYCSLELNV